MTIGKNVFSKDFYVHWCLRLLLRPHLDDAVSLCLSLYDLPLGDYSLCSFVFYSVLTEMIVSNHGVLLAPIPN